MKTGRDHVLIKIKNHFLEKRGSILMDTSINKEQHFVNTGTVVAIPIKMSMNRYLPIAKETVLKPSGAFGTPDFVIETDDDEFRAMSYMGVMYDQDMDKKFSYNDIHQDVNIGDKIYFNWMALAKESNFVKKENGFEIWKVDYQSIYCAIRGEKIVMVGSYCLIEPEWESFEDILVPLYYPMEITGGKKVLRPKNEWLQTKVEPEADELIGTVKHVGNPLKGDECYVKPGDRIMFMKGSKLNIEVEGEKYYAIRQHRIMAFIENEK